MKRSIASLFVVVAVAILMLAGCSKREKAAKGDAAATETIAPAAPQPAPTGTDAMTQTVDVESGRSEAEGGLSSPDVTTDTAATTATSATVAKPAPPPGTSTR